MINKEALSRRLSRRTFIRGTAIGGIGLAGAFVFGCGEPNENDKWNEAQKKFIQAFDSILDELRSKKVAGTEADGDTFHFGGISEDLDTIEYSYQFPSEGRLYQLTKLKKSKKNPYETQNRELIIWGRDVITAYIVDSTGIGKQTDRRIYKEGQGSLSGNDLKINRELINSLTGIGPGFSLSEPNPTTGDIIAITKNLQIDFTKWKRGNKEK